MGEAKIGIFGILDLSLELLFTHANVRKGSSKLNLLVYIQLLKTILGRLLFYGVK